MNSYLSALALLKTSYDQHGVTYLDYVTPFVGDTIRSVGRKQINTAQVRSALIDRYGLEIPEGVLNTLIRRLTKRGYGTRSHGFFHPNLRELAESFDLAEKRAEINLAIETLTKSLVDFASKELGREFLQEEAIGALTRYADSNGLPILRQAYGHEVVMTSLSMDETEYITSRFVIHAFEDRLAEMEWLVMLAKGSKLASVLYLPDPEDASRKIDGLTAIFDTPTLLSALGYDGIQQERAAREILTLAYQSGLDIAVFDHTLIDLESVLSAVGTRMNLMGNSVRPTWGVETHFLELGYEASDIQLLAGNLERDLASLRVNVLERPDFLIQLSIDEAALEKKLFDQVRYQRREPMLHDLNALTATFRKRRGLIKTKFEDCKAVFVTPNTSLARTAREFFQDHYGNHWPLAVTEDDFATLLWLKQPLAAPDLPKHRVVADAYAALEPGYVKWDSFLSQAEKLRENNEISEDDYYLLRYSSYAKDALIQETLGEPVGVTAEVARKIIDRVKSSIREPIQQEADRRQAELAEFQDSASKLEDSHAQELQMIERERNEALLAERIAKQQLDRLRKHARKKAHRWGSWCRRAVLLTAAMVIAIGIWSSLPASFGLTPDELPTSVRWIARGSVALLILAGALSSFFGWHLTQLARRFEVWVSKKLERRYLEDLDPDGPDSTDYINRESRVRFPVSR
ncbi:MAG: hypothetical protein OXH61_03555 [Acidimicrobiaceae bacterium]|nr:hypothetical protein [Acidimicrobiaceae bacterium]